MNIRDKLIKALLSYHGSTDPYDKMKAKDRRKQCEKGFKEFLDYAVSVLNRQPGKVNSVWNSLAEHQGTEEIWCALKVKKYYYHVTFELDTYGGDYDTV